MQKYGEIKDLVNAVLESYDKYPEQNLQDL